MEWEEYCAPCIAYVDARVASEHVSDEEMERKMVKPFVASRGIPTVWLRDLKAPVTPNVGELAVRNAHPRDRYIVAAHDPFAYMDEASQTMLLEDCHTYFIHGSCENIVSVTTLDGLFWEPFDSKATAERTLKSATYQQRWHQKSYKYHNCRTVEDIEHKWTCARNAGTALHAVVEHALNGLACEVPEENKTDFEQFLRFRRERFPKWTDFRTEWAVYDEELRIAGKIDYVAMDENGDLVIFDWKRVEDLTVQPFFGSMAWGKSVLSEYPDTKLNKYSCQLALYQRILQTKYGYRVSACYLVQFHPTLKDQCNVFPCVPMQFAAARIFRLRKNALQSYTFQQPTYADGHDTE